mgnify:CR=1 FL=1
MSAPSPYFVDAVKQGLTSAFEAKLASASAKAGADRDAIDVTEPKAPRPIWEGRAGDLQSVTQLKSGRIILPLSYVVDRSWGPVGWGYGPVDVSSQVTSYQRRRLPDDGRVTARIQASHPRAVCAKSWSGATSAPCPASGSTSSGRRRWFWCLASLQPTA